MMMKKKDENSNNNDNINTNLTFIIIKKSLSIKSLQVNQTSCRIL